MRWRGAKNKLGAPMPQWWEAVIGPYTFVVCWTPRAYRASYFLTVAGAAKPIGEYRTERQAKTYAYRRAKALVERMAREVRDS